MHIATFPTGKVGCFESTITTEKPPRYRIKDLNTLTDLVVHTYQPEITEPIKVYYQDMKQMNKSFEFNYIDLYQDSVGNNSICNVQPSQKVVAPRVFPPLPYPEKRNF